MTLETFITYAIAATALAIVPGPTLTVIIANSLRYGARAGLMNVVGTQLGAVIWLAVAALGLQAAIAVMGVWFDVLRIAGAAYLVWLGIKLLRSDGTLGAGKAEPVKRNFLLQGFTVIMANPKMLVLFGMIIPPFLTPGGNAFQETLLLGGTFLAIALTTDTLYALLAGRAGTMLKKSRVRAVEVISGFCLIAGGIWMAVRGRV